MHIRLRRNRIKSLAMLAVPIVFIACQQAQQQSTGPAWIHFSCDNGALLQLQFDPQQQTASMMYQSQRYSLQQMRTASGFGYQNDYWQLQGKGNSLLVQSPNAKAMHCSANS